MSTEGPDHAVFRALSSPNVEDNARPQGYRFELWEPSLTRPLPPAAPPLTYGTWWLFQHAGVFRNPGYAVVLVWHGNVVAHRLGVFPGWFRFPFMGKGDLQLGDLWTSPEHRGRGLATSAVRFAIRNRSGDGARTFWYLANEGNEPSIRTAERAGLSRFGRAVRTRRWGTRLLGRFELRGLDE